MDDVNNIIELKYVLDSIQMTANEITQSVSEVKKQVNKKLVN
jgi:hypothetical protein